MADTQTKQAPTKDEQSNEDFFPNMTLGERGSLPGFDAMQAFRLGALNIEHLISTQQELTRFMSHRIRRNLTTLDAFARCKSSEEVLSAVAKAASDTVHDYANEYDRVFAINLAAAR